MKEREYLSREQVAELMKVSINTVYSWTRKGWIKFNRVGRITKEDLYKQLDQNLEDE